MKRDFSMKYYVATGLLLLVFAGFVWSYQYHGKLKREHELASVIAKKEGVLIELIHSEFKLAAFGDEGSRESLNGNLKTFNTNLNRFYNGGVIEGQLKDIPFSALRDSHIRKILDAIRYDWNKYEKGVDKLLYEINEISIKKRRQGIENLTDEFEKIAGTVGNLDEQLGNKALEQSEIESFSLSGAISFFVVLVLSIYTMFNGLYFKPFRKILKVSSLVSRGILSEKILFYPENRIGRIAQAVDEIIEGQVEASNVLNKIGDANFNIDFSKKSPDDVMGDSIETMRSKLHDFFEEDKKRSHISNWSNKGLATFAEILRNNTDDLIDLCDKMLSNLVKYMEANQGGIFLLETDSEIGEHLALVSTYAWRRKKHLEKRFPIGEGIIGQAVLEKGTVYMTDVPNDFVTLTSGLGDSNPGSILIVPIKVNEVIFGVIELASFKEYEDHEIIMVEKIAESMGSSISTVRGNEHTKKLLQDSQELTEAMRSQEEELRQNAEELQATQESINQKLEIIDFEKKKNTAILETCADGVLVFNEHGIVEFFNDASENIWALNRNDVLGKEISEIVNLVIDHKDHKVFYQLGDSKLPIGVRTEINVTNSTGEDIPVLMTISVNHIGSTYIYAAFIQSISVELF